MTARRTTRRWAVLGLLVVLVVAVSGCGRLAERATERAVEGAIGKAVGADVEIDRDGESFKIESDEGSVEFGSSASLPDDFPDDLPLPDGLEIANATRMANDDGVIMSIMASSDQDFDALLSWFKERLPAAGWDLDQESEMSADDYRQAGMHATGHGYEAAIVVQHMGEGQDEATTSLQITLQQEGAG